MSYEIKFFGNEGRHDKIWGYATVQDAEVYTFWTRRGKKLAFQKQTDPFLRARENMERTAWPQRRSAPYVCVSSFEIEDVWSGFAEDFEHQLFLAKMSNTFRRGAEEEEEAEC